MSVTLWDLCFICQTDRKGDSLRSSKDGRETLATNIPKFYEKGKLKFHYDRVKTNDSSLLSILNLHDAKYHHNCAADYSTAKLKRLVPTKKKSNECDGDGEVPRKITRGSAESNEEFSLFCCWCEQNDDSANLTAAGAFHAKNDAANFKHLQEQTEKWKKMALTLNHEGILRRLSSGDVASNELFYHMNCLNKYRNKYNSAVKKSSKGHIEVEDADSEKRIALKKVIFYLKDTETACPGTLFSVADLEDMYANFLISDTIVHKKHSTRFADLLVNEVSGLKKKTDKKAVNVFFDSATTGTGTSEETYFDSLIRVIEPVRNAMHKLCKINSRSLTVDKKGQISSVPIELLTLINLLQDGINLKDEGFSKESLAISQVIMYNFRYNVRKEGISSYKRHNQCTETPFPLYVAVKIYSKCRSKTLINWLYFVGGISLPYKSILELTRDIGNRIIAQYENDGVFLPSILRKGILTIIAKDNIDQNSKSTTASKHCHQTSLSVFQFPTVGNPGEPLLKVKGPSRTSTSLKVDLIPSSYTCIKNFLMSFNTLYPNPKRSVTCPDSPDSIYTQGVEDELQWLQNSNQSDDIWVPWARHHSSKERSKVRPQDISAILPLIDAPVHTLDTQYHCMDIVDKTVKKLNPGQICVDESDQPVFAISKQLQWRFPEQFGPDKYFCLFGSLHIEKSILALCGIMIKGSGLDAILSCCELSIVGSESLVTVNHIKKARYCLQVSICMIYSFLESAYQESGDTQPVMDWLRSRSETSEMCRYWHIILQMMLNLLIFVRSIREGNFLLYVSSLRHIVKWYFALDHYHYARWIAVHLHDLVSLPQTSPYLYNCFLDGYFAFQKSDRKCSLMGIDQAHEQNNAVIKGMGGAVPFVNKEDESALARWELCLHELSLIVTEYEGVGEPEGQSSDPLSHHEDSQRFQEIFSKDVTHLKEVTLTNPFKMDKLTVLNQETASFNDSIIEDIQRLSKCGEEQFQSFWSNRLDQYVLPITEPITLNSYNLPGNYNKCAEKDPVFSSQMMAKLKDAAKYRKDAVEIALDGEVFGICQPLAKNQYTLYHGTKSHITKPFITSTEPNFDKKDGGIVIELSQLLRKTKESWVKTFKDYARFLYQDIMKTAESFHRCDIVTDQYFSGSLKEGVRDNRGSAGVILPFNDQTPLPSKFESNFLTNGTNKTNLNEYLAQKFIAFHHNESQVLCVTYRNGILSNYPELLNEESIANCSSEEADPRIIRHAINLGRNGYKNVQIQTVDSDILILSFGYAGISKDVGIEKLFVIYGPNRKCYDIFENMNHFGAAVCEALPFFHALTGCDTTSSFYKIGKTTFWAAWMKIHQHDHSLTNAFIRLSNQPTDIDTDTLNIISQFIYQCYGLDAAQNFSPKTLRVKQLTNTPDLSLRNLAPSIYGILQHIKRCCIQVGYLWKLSECEVTIPDPKPWGWTLGLNTPYYYVPLWQDRETYDINKVLKICSCSKGNCSNCSCKKGGLKCLTYCKCDKQNCANHL